MFAPNSRVVHPAYLIVVGPPVKLQSTVCQRVKARAPMLLVALSWLATVATVGFFMVNIPTALEFYRTKSTGNVQFFPLIAMMLNCLAWLAYGYVRQDSAVLIVNSVGLFLAIFYVISFVMFATPQQHPLIRKMLMYSFAGISVFGIYCYVLDPDARVMQLGLLAACGSMAMFGSPLATLNEIISSRDASTISFPMCAMALVVSSLWTLYGAALGDSFIVIPNFVGLCLAAVQLFLIYKYKDSHRQSPIQMVSIGDHLDV